MIRTVCNPLRPVFSKIEIFSGTAKFSSLYARGPKVPPRVFGPVGPKTLRGQLGLRRILIFTNTNRAVWRERAVSSPVSWSEVCKESGEF